MTNVTPDQQRVIREAYARLKSYRAVAKELRCAYTTVERCVKAPDPDEELTPGERRIENGDNLELEWASDHRIVSVDDALAFGKVDTEAWYVDRFECVSWESVLKLRAPGMADRPVKKQMWRIKLWLKRILPKPFQAAHEALFERMAQRAPKYPRLARPRITRESHLLEIDLFDAHFGKLAWAPETGQSYDLRIAERIYANAVDDLVQRASGYRVDKVILPIGSDFFHVDGPRNSTTSGTQVDADGRYAKIIETGEMAVVRAVEFLAKIAPVEVVWVPGNHDRVSSYHLSRFILAWFHNSNRVTVDRSPKSRKYVSFGASLIGYAHGDTMPAAGLPTIMAVEEPERWARSKYREWRIGHIHKSKRLDSVSVDTHNGVVVRVLRSLSATDAWHYDKGYVGGTRAAEAFLLSARDGPVAQLSANAREK